MSIEQQKPRSLNPLEIPTNGHRDVKNKNPEFLLPNGNVVFIKGDVQRGILALLINAAFEERGLNNDDLKKQYPSLNEKAAQEGIDAGVKGLIKKLEDQKDIRIEREINPDGTRGNWRYFDPEIHRQIPKPPESPLSKQNPIESLDAAQPSQDSNFVPPQNQGKGKVLKRHSWNDVSWALVASNRRDNILYFDPPKSSQKAK